MTSLESQGLGIIASSVITLSKYLYFSVFLHILIPVKLNCFCCRADCGDGCSGEGGVALLGRGGAGDDGVEEVVDEGLLLESGWYGTGI